MKLNIMAIFIYIVDMVKSVLQEGNATAVIQWL